MTNSGRIRLGRDCPIRPDHPVRFVRNRSAQSVVPVAPHEETPCSGPFCLPMSAPRLPCNEQEVSMLPADILAQRRLWFRLETRPTALPLIPSIFRDRLNSRRHVYVLPLKKRDPRVQRAGPQNAEFLKILPPAREERSALMISPSCFQHVPACGLVLIGRLEPWSARFTNLRLGAAP